MIDLVLFFAAFAAVAYFGYKHWKKTQAKPGPEAPTPGTRRGGSKVNEREQEQK